MLLFPDMDQLMKQLDRRRLDGTSFSLPGSGCGKKLLPSSVNEPRFPPSILRRTAYFQ